MSHYAVVTPPLFSHIRAMEALAQYLIDRGHRITFFQQPGARPLLREPRVHFVAVGQDTGPAAISLPYATGVLRLTTILANTTDMLCRTLPQAFKQQGIEGVIADQMEPAGGLVAQALGLPFVSVACALPVNRDETIPLPVMPFRYTASACSRKLYTSSVRIYDRLMAQQGKVIACHARAFGLTARSRLDECLSPLAQISQTIPGFDFPRQLPACFHAVGPLRRKPVHRQNSDKQPFVFASLGTMQGHRYGLFRTIASACRQAGIALLIAHCDGLNIRQIQRLERDGVQTISFTDQVAILQQASVVITHGGLNTVMDAIATATPVLAIPLAFDQPGVAARVVFSGIGRKASRFSCSRTLSRHLHELLHDQRYRRRLSVLQKQLSHAGGASRAARIVEQALETRHIVPTGSV
ncbi:TPA: glycosyltransferase [Citrobacter freundii]